jgi:hypothetical protein
MLQMSSAGANAGHQTLDLWRCMTAQGAGAGQQAMPPKCCPICRKINEERLDSSQTAFMCYFRPRREHRRQGSRPSGNLEP